MLQLNKTRREGPCKTFKPSPSSAVKECLYAGDMNLNRKDEKILSDVKNFLPKLAMSNQILKETVESGEGDSVNMEYIDHTDDRIIQIDLALVEQDSDSEDSDSSEESIQGEISEENIKLEPKCKNKPVIELIKDTPTEDTVTKNTPTIGTSAKDTPTTNILTKGMPIRDLYIKDTNTKGGVSNDRQQPVCDDG